MQNNFTIMTKFNEIYIYILSFIKIHKVRIHTDPTITLSQRNRNIRPQNIKVNTKRINPLHFSLCIYFYVTVSHQRETFSIFTCAIILQSSVKWKISRRAKRVVARFQNLLFFRVNENYIRTCLEKSRIEREMRKNEV